MSKEVKKAFDNVTSEMAKSISDKIDEEILNDIINGKIK